MKLRGGIDIENLKSVFSAILYSKRMERDLSQEKMAVFCCMSIRQYSDLETGKRLPNFQTLINISINCDIDLNEMLDTIKSKNYVVTDKIIQTDDV